MSGVSGSSGAARRAIHEFDAALDDASAPDTTSQEKVSKSEMKEALKELAPVQGKLTARNRNEIWAKIEQHALTPTARKLAEQTIGPDPAIGPMPSPGAGLPKDGPKLSKALATLAKDLTFMSESDYPFKAFSSPLDPRKKASDDDLRKAFKLSPGTPVNRTSAADWFKDMQDPQVVSDPATRAQWKALQDAVGAGLKDVELVYTKSQDVVEAKVYLVGRAPDGSVTGLSSTRIWT